MDLTSTTLFLNRRRIRSSFFEKKKETKNDYEELFVQNWTNEISRIGFITFVSLSVIRVFDKMFNLGKTIQLSTTTVVRAFHTSKPVFLFGGGVIKVKEFIWFNIGVIFSFRKEQLYQIIHFSKVDQKIKWIQKIFLLEEKEFYLVYLVHVSFISFPFLK